jgi:hypothetical protein
VADELLRGSGNVQAHLAAAGLHQGQRKLVLSHRIHLVDQGDMFVEVARGPAGLRILCTGVVFLDEQEHVARGNLAQGHLVEHPADRILDTLECIAALLASAVISAGVPTIP